MDDCLVLARNACLRPLLILKWLCASDSDVTPGLLFSVEGQFKPEAFESKGW